MSQFYVICFDIANDKRLRKVAIQMENFGQRIQYSVFECYLDKTQLDRLQTRLQFIIDPEKDHIRYYHLCNKDYKKIQLDGIGNISPNNDYHLL